METDADRNSDVSGPEPEPPAAAPPPPPPSDAWVTSQLLAPPPAACHSQLIIVEQRGQAPPADRHVVIVTGQSEGREVFVIPSNQLAVISGSPTGPVDPDCSSQPPREQPAAGSSLDVSAQMKPVASLPSWAVRLRNVQKLGDSFRGFCSSEAELEAILCLHKQQTGCVFGTRQSPSVDKPATRLMWKSQYVPYDGIPFINTGSRAIVMECQFGPRRKGLQPPHSSELSAHGPYRATCPARIYIKKVRKFPEFRVPVEPSADRKTVRQEQEKSFQGLKTQNHNLETGGVLRFYLQLPTERAHLYHTVETPPLPPLPPDLPPPPPTQPEEEEEEEEEEQDGAVPSRLHPRVAEKIRQLVAAGHHQVYSVRKQLRRFVEKELFKCDGLPERHNLRYFPTVNDIKNHIHEAQKALGLTTATEWTEDITDPLMETVTLTLTPAAEVVDVSLSPDAVQLFTSLSSLQPRIFAQLQGIVPPAVSTSSLLQTPAEKQLLLQNGENSGERAENSGENGENGENGESVLLQIISSPANTEHALLDVNVLQMEEEEDEEQMKRRKNR